MACVVQPNSPAVECDEPLAADQGKENVMYVTTIDEMNLWRLIKRVSGVRVTTK